jgi:hypothetical protein
MIKTRNMIATLAAVVLAGCASIPAPYQPMQAGNLNDGSGAGSIAVVLNADRDTIRRGDTLRFSVAIQNVGTQPVVLPRDPDTQLTWVYPDGRRDNLIKDSAAPANSELVRLEPGQQLTHKSTIPTYYFHRSGITEFRAIVSAAGTGNTWNGRAVSNGFGVMVE